ncbi:MAG: Hsp20/alpha crystallin family protein [Lachnospiraceae bacterium]|nr:Hsp20/alpha crystallin family protein [Lachnospiraceae bacterium]
MLRPSIYRENLWDDFFDDAITATFYGRGQQSDMMRTDVKENNSSYEITMNLPGVRKEDVKAELKDGYLTIKASTNSDNEKTDSHGRYVRRERFAGSYSRTFYVGDAVKQEDIRAKFENGTLVLTVPKEVQQPVIEDNKYITIE